MHRTNGYIRQPMAMLLVASAGTAYAGPPAINNWLSAGSGLWTDASRWSLGVAPGLPGATNTDVRIAAIGLPYTVTLNTFAAINDLSLASRDATLAVTGGGVMQVAGAATIGDDSDPTTGGLLLLSNGAIRGGTWSILGAGELRVRGTQPSRIDDATVLGDVLMETGSLLRVANSSIDRVRMLGNSSVLEYEDSEPIDGTISFEGPGAALRIVRTTAPDGLIHLASGATVETSDDFAGRGFIGTPSYTTESIVNDGRITATRGSINLGAATITNNGVMQALNASIITTSASFVNNATLELLNGVFTAGSSDPSSSLGLHNAGAITAVDSTLNIANGLDNSGTIDALRSTVFIDASRTHSTGRFDLVDSTLRVGGEFTLGDLNPITRTNSTIAIAGTLRNESQTLDLGALPDRLALDGGAIRGGSILAWEGALSVSSNLNNALDGVAYSGRLALDQADAFLRVRDGSTIEGLVEMSAGSPELRFEGSTTLNNMTINMSGVQHWFSSETAGQTLTFGPKATLSGREAANGSLDNRGPSSPFETIVNEGVWNVSGGDWQLAGARTIVNRGTISVSPLAELVLPSGLDLAQGSLTIEPNGTLAITQLGAEPILDPSFFDGGVSNHGLIEIGASIDFQGRSVTLSSSYGAVQIGTNYYSQQSQNLLRNGFIQVGEGASLTLKDTSANLVDMALTGGATIGENATAILTRTVADRLEIRGGTLTTTDASLSETLFYNGLINAADLGDLGHLRLLSDGNRTIRLTLASNGIAQAGQVTFDPGSRLIIESPATSSIVNRTDWNLSNGARLTLNASAVVNEAGIILAPGASLTIEGTRPFLNPGSLVLNGGTVAIACPFEFDEILNRRNDLVGGRIVIDRDLNLEGSTLTLGATDGQWALSSRRSLINGVVDNADGQPFLMYGSSASFLPPSRLENIQFSGDVIASSRVFIGESVAFRSMVIDDEVVIEGDANINGVLVQRENTLVDVRLQATADGVVRIADSGGVVATGRQVGDTSRTVQILAEPGVGVLENRGEIVVKRAGRLDSYGLSQLHNYGLFSVDPLSRVYLEGLSLLNEGEVRLSSRVNVDIRGDLVLGETSLIRFELGETNASSAGLIAGGDAYLDGLLEITVTDDTSIAVGDRWDLLNTTSVLGDFASVTFDTLDDPDLRLALLMSDGPSDPNLEVFVRHIADVNADMAVDIDDLNLVLNGYGESGSLLTGDANTDGVVDFADLNIVLTNFGRTFSSRAVPAPGAALSFAGAAVLAATRRRRSP